MIMPVYSTAFGALESEGPSAKKENVKILND